MLPAADMAGKITDVSSAHSDTPESSAPVQSYAETYVAPPKDLTPKRANPNRTSSQQPTLPDEAKAETEYGIDNNPSNKRFDETNLNRAVVSLFESDCVRLIHDNRFDDRIFRETFPVEFDKLKYRGSPIKAGVLSVLSLVDVSFP
jgi:hypothetical protein